MGSNIVRAGWAQSIQDTFSLLNACLSCGCFHLCLVSPEPRSLSGSFCSLLCDSSSVDWFLESVSHRVRELIFHSRTRIQQANASCEASADQFGHQHARTVVDVVMQTRVEATFESITKPALIYFR